MRSLSGNARRKTISTKQGHRIEYDEINAVHSKSVIDEIDTALAELFNLSPNELDFVISYDVKYRMGSETEQEPDEVTAAAAN
jgi:hypothetical protein